MNNLPEKQKQLPAKKRPEIHEVVIEVPIADPWGGLMGDFTLTLQTPAVDVVERMPGYEDKEIGNASQTKQIEKETGGLDAGRR